MAKLDFEFRTDDTGDFRVGDFVQYRDEETGMHYGVIHQFERYGDVWCAYLVDRGDGTLDDYAAGGIEPRSKLEHASDFRKLGVAMDRFVEALRAPFVSWADKMAHAWLDKH